MKKTMRSVIAIALLVVTVVSVFTGCGSSKKSLEKKIVGAWTAEMSGEEIVYTFGELLDTTDEDFPKAGTLSMGNGSIALALHQYYWALDGDEIQIIKRAFNLSGSVSTNVIGTLTIQQEGREMVLVNEQGDVFHKNNEK